jgi:ABC-2 type transport system ATP-binding protein
MNAINVSGLRKSFKAQAVLGGVSFNVKRGEIFALLGSNGAGKTTTVKILTTLLRADEGAAQVCGFDVRKQGREVRACISLTGQFAAVDDIQTGRENLIMVGKLRHLPDPETEAEKQLEAFGLTDAADKPLSVYSGGMRRRLDLAMSMVGGPRGLSNPQGRGVQVVFLDEPTIGLDPQSRLSVWNTIRKMSKSGATIFLTTQHLEEADSLADKIAVLHKGTIAAEGTAAELKKLAPPPKLELSFLEETHMARAREILTEYQTEAGALTLLVMTDGSVKQAAAILYKLESAGIAAAFAQKPPTLEEAFLSIIKEGTK